MRKGKMRFLPVVVVASLALASATPQIAAANLTASDPDDSVTLDMSSVASTVSGTPTRIRFRADFWDPIRWIRDPVVQFFVDSSGGDHLDRVVLFDIRHGRKVCLLYDRAGRLDARLGAPHVGPDHVSCSLRRSLLPTDGTAIRWRATSIYRDDVPGPAPDKAPNAGWFAHV